MYNAWMSIPRIGRIGILLSVLIGVASVFVYSLPFHSDLVDALVFGLAFFVGLPATLMLYIDLHSKNEGEDE